MTATKIEWAERVWNPIAGCSVVSPGCTNCYAMRVAYRHGFNQNLGSRYLGLAKMVNGNPIWTGKVRQVETALDLPLRWRKPARIFVNSMSDLFHEKVPDDWIDRIFAVMALCPRHTFMALTKRPERMRTYLAGARINRGGYVGVAPRDHLVSDAADRVAPDWQNTRPQAVGFPWPLQNVWLGVSVEDQARADERIPILLDTPAAIRFISAEPLLGPIKLEGRWAPWLPRSGGTPIPSLDWVIVGGESGPGARPCDLAWVRIVKDQCKAAGVPVFVKQLGAHVLCVEGDSFHWSADTDIGWRAMLKDRKGGDPSEWPADLRMRQWPT